MFLQERHTAKSMASIKMYIHTKEDIVMGNIWNVSFLVLPDFLQKL